MKVPKQVKKYCPKCKKHTEQKVMQGKKRTRSTARPQSKGSTVRVRKRGLRRGHGNYGKYSKSAIKVIKQTKKTDLRYTCSQCKKTSMQKKGKRAKSVELV